METKITRYQTTEYNRYSRVALAVHDAYSCARSFGWTHEELRSRLSERVYQTRDYAKLTPYYRGKLAGLTECLMDAQYRHDLKWQLFLDGAPVTSNEVSVKREMGDDNVWFRVQGAHVWVHKPERFFSALEAMPR